MRKNKILFLILGVLVLSVPSFAKISKKKNASKEDIASTLEKTLQKAENDLIRLENAINGKSPTNQTVETSKVEEISPTTNSTTMPATSVTEEIAPNKNEAVSTETKDTKENSNKSEVENQSKSEK